MHAPPDPNAIQALWRTLTRIDRSKINHWMAVRNALAVAIPLSIGIELHHPLAGVAIATGALNVAYSDGSDPYSTRARRMFGWSVLGAVAVFIGSLTGRISWLAVLAAALWAFMAGMLVSVNTRMGDLGLNTLVTLVVYGARGALPLAGASITGALVLLGGLIQTAFSLLFWPVRRYEPERRVIADVYGKLSKEINPTAADPLTTALTPVNQQTQDVIAALGADHSLEGERYRLLFDQVDRVRMSVFVIERLRAEFRNLGQTKEARTAEELLSATAELIESIGKCLGPVPCAANQAECLEEVMRITRGLRASSSVNGSLQHEFPEAAEVLAGQLRMIVQLAMRSLPDGAEEFAREQRSHPWRLQIATWIGTMRANLNPRSAFFRHAVRLSTCVTIGDAAGRMISWERTYWIPMTIAVVLKPDFNTTISRGVLRLAGTYAGLGVATVLYHLMPDTALTELLLVGVFTLFLRSLGPANYGVFSVAISGLIVFLIAETGITPAQVIAERAVNTAAGGIFALVAYALWPTWERTQVHEVIADMLDACRHYLQAVARRFGTSEATGPTDLDPYRAEWRRTRSAAEASVDRFASEPRTSPDQLRTLRSILASSHALVHSIMGLEAEVLKQHATTAPDSFKQFTHDVELTLYFIASALRGSSGAMAALPKLREDHTRMVQARDRFSMLDDLVLIETDSLTTSLNTLREHVTRLTGTGLRTLPQPQT
jgi:uncharacterized membrane protein YccC